MQFSGCDLKLIAETLREQIRNEEHILDRWITAHDEGDWDHDIKEANENIRDWDDSIREKQCLLDSVMDAINAEEGVIAL